MEMVQVQCSFCGKIFERDKGVVNFRKKIGMRIYCSKKCVGRQNFSQLLPYGYKCQDGDVSPFRVFLRHAKGASGVGRKKECSLTLLDLKEQWDKQQGICPYTGWKMDNPNPCRHVNQGKMPMHIRRASLDRIDSSKDYTKDNIQFVSLIAQYAKNRFSEKELFEFCKAVVDRVGSEPTSSDILE